MLRDSKISAEGKVVWLVLASMAERYDDVYFSHTTIGEDCGLERRVVLRVIGELMEAGWVCGQSRPGQTSLYSVNRCLDSNQYQNVTGVVPKQDNHLYQNRTTTCQDLVQDSEGSTEKERQRGEGLPTTSTEASKEMEWFYSHARLEDDFRTALGMGQWKPSGVDNAAAKEDIFELNELKDRVSTFKDCLTRKKPGSLHLLADAVQDIRVGGHAPSWKAKDDEWMEREIAKTQALIAGYQNGGTPNGAV